jgi:hypothetical protein
MRRDAARRSVAQGMLELSLKLPIGMLIIPSGRAFSHMTRQIHINRTRFSSRFSINGK